MAYELFEDLSTCDLDEICVEDLEKVVEDCRNELERRDALIKEETVAKFKSTFEDLLELGVTIDYHYNDPCTSKWQRISLEYLSHFEFNY